MKKKTKRLLLLLCILLLLISIPLFMQTETPLKKNCTSIPIIGFHHLASDEDKRTDWLFDPWTSSLSSFKKQMKYLHDNGYQTISMDDFYAWYQGEKQFSNKTVVLSFDDSYYSTVELAKPILEEYGFQAAVFVIGSSIPEKTAPYKAPTKQHIPSALLKDDETLQYYSHFHRLHRKIDKDYAVNTYSLSQLKEDIQMAGQQVSNRYMAYPYGKYNKLVQQALKEEGIALAFSYNQLRDARREDAPYALPRYSVNAYTPMFLFRYFLNHDE